MKQLIFIHGWSRFPDNDAFCKELEKQEYHPFEEKKRRVNRLAEQLISQYQTIKTDMPNKQMASYKARKIWFEKIFPYFNNEDLIVIGNSLGAMFLIKYLWENNFPKTIKQLHLVAAVVDASDRSPDKQYLWDFEFNPDIFSKIQEKVEQIFIYHSTDDPIVPYAHAEKIKAYLPKAKLVTFTDRGHFSQPEFPELLENIVK